MREWFGVTRMLVLTRAVHRVPLLPASIPLEIKRVTDSSDPLLAQAMSSGRLRYARRCLDLGDTALIAVSNGVVAGWVWETSRSHRDPSTRLRVNLLPGELYHYDGWVVDAYRQHGVFQHVYSVLSNSAADRDDGHRIVTYIYQSNRSIRRALVPFGFEPVQQIRLVVLLVRYAFPLPFTTRPRRGGPLSRSRTGEDVEDASS